MIFIGVALSRSVAEHARRVTHAIANDVLGPSLDSGKSLAGGGTNARGRRWYVNSTRCP